MCLSIHTVVQWVLMMRDTDWYTVEDRREAVAVLLESAAAVMQLLQPT
jgi:hypothetical protein